MLRLQRPKANRKMRSKTETYTAPIRGLNYRDPLPNMNPMDALQLDNMVCRTGYLEVRRGRVPTATGFSAPIETLMPYIPTSGPNELFAASGSNVYDATATGAIGAPVVTGLSSAYLNFTQISNVAGNFLAFCNGVDAAQIYDGATWSNLGVTGLTTSDIVQLAVWKRRLWCVEKESFSAWYSDVDAIAGPVTEFSFAGVFKRGGYLVAILNWTIDGGSGSDDYFVAVTSSGEAAVYQGTDPTDAATFALVGVYFIGPPVGTRFYAQLGGDLLLLTSEGLLPLSRYLQSQTVNKTSALTDRIQQLVSADISNYGAVDGWEVHVYHDDNFLFLQVPAGPGQAYQYVMSLITGAWSRFLVNNAQTWAVSVNILYMGDSSQVYNAWSGGTDDGNAITFIVVPAFSYFKSPTTLKKFNLSRILFRTDTCPKFQTVLLLDFNQDFYFGPMVPCQPSGNLWDIAIWDEALWDTITTYSRTWYALAGLGYAATQAIYGVSAGESTQMISIDYAFEEGGLL